jgi:hypothetical protein
MAANNINPDSLLPTLFKIVELKATIYDKYFRENGTKIYLCQHPNEDYKNYYKSRISNFKKRYGK